MIHTEILNFLRDAQFRIGELTEEIDELYNIGEIESPKVKHRLRLELLTFMEVLYEINWTIDGTSYNHIVSHPGEEYIAPWTEQMILDEIEYLRIHCGMSEQPLMTFVPFFTEIVNEVVNADNNFPGGGVTITGTNRQMLMFNSSNELFSTDIDPYGGMKPNETINEYFSGRP